MQDQLRKRFLVSLLALVWLLIAFAGYIYIHKPFSTAQLLAIAQALWNIIVPLAILSIAGGIGNLTPLRDLDIPPVSMAALTAALGLGVISLGILVVGATLGINALMWVLLAAAFVLLRKPIAEWWRYWRGVGVLVQEAGTLGRVIFMMIVALVFCQLLLALAPPLWFDSLTYHLAIPRELTLAGRIVYLPNTMEWGNARQIETLYIAAMLAAGAQAATVLGWAIGVMTLLALVDFSARLFSKDVAWVAAASLMCGPALSGLLASGYVEWEAMLFGLATWICLAQWTAEMDRSTLLMAGIFAGLAFDTKYTGVFVFVIGATVILLFQKPGSMKQTVGKLVIYGCSALVVTLPWLLKNFLPTSNPFYPLFFPGGAMDRTRLAFYQMSPIKDWSRLILLPWQVTVWGLDGAGGFAASIGPLLLGLAPMGLLLWKETDPLRRRILGVAAVITLSTWVIWATASQFNYNLMETRYYLPSFTAWALLCAAGFSAAASLQLGSARIRIVAGALVLLALGFNLFGTVTGLATSNPLPVILGTESQDSYRERNLGGYELAMETVRALPGNPHVLMLWETRGFECVLVCDSDEIIDRWRNDWLAYGDPAAVVQAWKQQGYTHVLLNRQGLDFILSDDPNRPAPQSVEGLNQALAMIPLIKSVGGYQLYALH